MSEEEEKIEPEENKEEVVEAAKPEPKVEKEPEEKAKEDCSCERCTCERKSFGEKN
jgi:hypothetical protein